MNKRARIEITTPDDDQCDNFIAQMPEQAEPIFVDIALFRLFRSFT